VIADTEDPEIKYGVFEMTDGIHVMEMGENHLPDEICWCCPVIDNIINGVVLWVHRSVH